MMVEFRGQVPEEQGSGKGRDKVGEKVGKELAEGLAERLVKNGGSATQETTQETTQEKILTILKARPETTRKELAAQIGITPDGIKYHLAKLRKAGAIRHVGPTKAGHWEVLEKDS
jgi:predicted HTH transcriptional regulator